MKLKKRHYAFECLLMPLSSKKLTLYLVGQNTICRGLYVFVLQDSAIEGLLQAWDLGQFVDNSTNKKKRLVIANWEQTVRIGARILLSCNRFIIDQIKKKSLDLSFKNALDNLLDKPTTIAQIRAFLRFVETRADSALSHDWLRSASVHNIIHIHITTQAIGIR